MAKVKFITEDIMLRNTYLYENKMFQKSECSIIWGGKEKLLMLINIVN